MIVLQAPHSLPQTTTLLPDPDYEDAEGVGNALTTKTARDGTLYSYVRSSPRRTLAYSFWLTKDKSLELIAFYKAYAGEEIRLTNHKGEIWRVYFTEEVLEINTPIGAEHITDLNELVRSERQEVTLQFEGVKLG